MDLTLNPNTEVSAGPGITAFDFNVMHGQLRVGRIRREAALKSDTQWIWVVSVYDGPEAMRRSGMAATIEEAQAALVLIPRLISQNLFAQSRSPMDMILQG